MNIGEISSLTIAGFVAVGWACAYVVIPFFRKHFPDSELPSAVRLQLLERKEGLLRRLEELELENRTEKLAPGEFSEERERLLSDVARCISELESVGSLPNGSVD